MAFLSWRKEYEIGVAAIDAEHRRLVGLANDFNDALAEGDNSGAGGKMLTQLIAYAEEHFQHEEHLMRENGYPGLDKHQAQHVGYISDIFAVNEKIAPTPRHGEHHSSKMAEAMAARPCAQGGHGFRRFSAAQDRSGEQAVAPRAWIDGQSMSIRPEELHLLHFTERSVNLWMENS